MSLIEQDYSIVRLSSFPRGRLYGADAVVKSCTANAAACRPGDVFVALDSSAGDGHYDVEQAVAAGASAVVAERFLPIAVPQCIVADSREAFAWLCQELAGNPSRRLSLMAVCGSRGVSATAALLESVLATSGCGVAERMLPAQLEDRDGQDNLESHCALRLAKRFADARADGYTHSVVELSSRMLSSRVLSGTQLHAAILTNLGSDFLDWHGTTARYHQALLRVVDHLSPSGYLVINVDDKGTQATMEQLPCPVLTVGMRGEAEVTAQVLERHPSEQTFLVNAGRDSVPVRVSVTGDAYIYACLSAIGVGLVSEMPLELIVRGIERAQPGSDCLRHIYVDNGPDVFFSDSATPVGLRESLAAVTHVTKGRVFCVLGEGPERNRDRRAQRGTVAEKYADRVVVTADQVCASNRLQAAHDLLDGFDRPAAAHLLPDRARAVDWAISQARSTDSVLIVGAGESSTAVPYGVGPSDIDIVRTWIRANQSHEARGYGYSVNR